MLVAFPPQRRIAGASGRAPYQRHRTGCLSERDREAIRLLGDYRTLRELAAEFGVSHETVRAGLRGRTTAAAAADR